jgi:hypothetical protein
MVVAVCAGLAFWAKDRVLTAPPWMRDQIQSRLDVAVPGAHIAFGDIVLVLEDGWRPRVSVRNVVVSTPGGAEVIAVSEARAGFDSSALLEGRVALQSLDLSGVFLTLLRDEDGAVALFAGLSGGSVRQRAPNLAELVAELDELLLRPALAELNTASLRALTLRYEDARSRRGWTVDGGRLRLDRDGNAIQIAVDLAVLGGGAEAATLSASYAGHIGSRASEFGVTLAGLDAGDIASQSAGFAWMQALKAPISGALRGGLYEDGKFWPLNATFQIGAGVIQPTPEAKPIPIDGARSYFTYHPASRLLRFDELSVQSQWGKGRLEGQAALNGIGNQVTDMVGQFRLSGLEINPAELYPAPVALPDAEMDFRLSFRPFALQLGRLEVIDQGQRLTVSGTVGADSTGWDIAVDAQMDGLDPARLMTLWPEGVKVKSRKWISENVITARLSDIDAALRLKTGQPPETYLGFDYSAADVRFLKEMPLITGSKGHVTLLRNRFVLVADEGQVVAVDGGVVDLKGSSFIIPDVKAKETTPGVVRLLTRSSATAALSMLDQPPLKVMQKAGLPVALAQGEVLLSGTLALPLVKGTKADAVEFDVTGEIRSVESRVLIKDRVLSAPRIALTASEVGVELSGQGDLDGVPFDAKWSQPIGREATGRSRIAGEVALTPEALDTFRITLPPNSVQGAGRGDITVDLAKGIPPRLSLQSDLVGLRLSLPPINFTKAAATPGTLSLTATLGDVPKVEELVLSAPGLDASGSVTLTPARQLDRVRFDRVRAGNWLDAPIDLIGRGTGAPIGIALRGGKVDLRKASLGGGGGQAPVDLAVELDTLQVTDAIAIRDLRGDFNTAGGLSGPFEGRVNGGAPVQGVVRPVAGRTAIDLTASDAGAVIASAGLVKQVRGGQMKLTLTPVGTGGAFDGDLNIRNTSIQDAPTMAALLNAISGVGLVNELNGDGIYFSAVNADFRLAPGQIILREASAEGSSMGISMDGVFATDTGQVQMQGVISPIYLLNAIGSVFTRKGEGLIGFNYSISGDVKAPDVYVNPFTALAPSGLRNLFRAPRPEVPLVEGETPLPSPEPRKAPVVVQGEDR